MSSGPAVSPLVRFADLPCREPSPGTPGCRLWSRAVARADRAARSINATTGGRAVARDVAPTIGQYLFDAVPWRRQRQSQTETDSTRHRGEGSTTGEGPVPRDESVNGPETARRRAREEEGRASSQGSRRDPSNPRSHSRRGSRAPRAVGSCGSSAAVAAARDSRASRSLHDLASCQSDPIRVAGFLVSTPPAN